jgi:signal transduction histidine kinase
VLTNTRKAGDIIWNIRNFLRGGELQAQPTDLNNLIRSLVPSMQQARGRARYRVELDLDEDLPPASCDPILIQECLTNLFHNAVEAMESTEESGADGKRVIIRTCSAGDGRVMTCVSDRGTGLPPGLQEQLVQPLFTTKSGGMGLGISICRSIVEAHEGKIWAVNNAPEPGTTFHFTLPASAGTEGNKGDQ